MTQTTPAENVSRETILPPPDQIVSRETILTDSSENVSRETITIAITNQKGGVGKTTTAVSLATDLANRGYRVLLIDLDPQGNATTSLGVDRYGEKIASTSYDLMLNPAGPGEPVHLGPGLPDLYPANVSLIRAEIELWGLGDRRDKALATSIKKLAPNYHFILFDSPPSLGIMTLNILIASRYILIPIQCEYLALEGLSMLLDTLEQIRHAHNPKLEILGCLITMSDLRTNLSQQVVADVRNHLGDRVFNTMIPRTVRLSECPSHGKSIFQYDRWGAGARSYESLTLEILDRLSMPKNTERK